MPATTVTWIQRGVLALIIVALAGFGLRATGKSVDALDLVDGMVWLSSQRNGSVVQASSAARAVTGRLNVAQAKDQIVTVQRGASALVLNRETGEIGRADGSALSWRAGARIPSPSADLQLLVGRTGGFVVDGASGKVHLVDLDDLSVRAEASVGAGVLGAAVDSDDLWLLNQNTGSLALVRADGELRAASNLDLSGGAALTLVGKDRVFAVDAARREVIEIDRRSVSGERRYCLGGKPSGPVFAVGTGSEASAPTVATLVPNLGQVLITDLATNTCSVVEIRALEDDADRAPFGQPVVQGDLLFAPVGARGEVVVVDLQERKVRRTIKLFPGGEVAATGLIELIVDDGTVWFNDPAGRSAGIIDGSGVVAAIDKFSEAGGGGDGPPDGPLALGAGGEDGEVIDDVRNRGVVTDQRIRPGDGGRGPDGQGPAGDGDDGTRGGSGPDGETEGGGGGETPEVVVSPSEPDSAPAREAALPEAPAPVQPPAPLAAADPAAPGGQGGSDDPASPPTTQPAQARLVATFQFSAASVRSGDAVQFTDRSSGNPTSWQWSFGDGTSSDARNPRKSYERPGVFRVVLTVGNGTATAVSLPATITVVATEADILPAVAVTPTAVSGEIEETFAFSASATAGRIVEWTWDFGDGAKGAGATINHAWETPGTYTVSLIGRDAQGRQAAASATATIVNRTAAPEASFTFAPTDAVRGEPVTFTDTSLNEPTSVVWDFGDGTGKVTGSRVSHVFAENGSYSVTLVASNRRGESTATRTIRVSDPAATPVARFQVSNARPQVREEVVFTSNSTGEPTRYSWQFSDRPPIEGGPGRSSITVSFAQAGEVTVTLTVSNDAGSSSTKPFTIVVSERPVVRPLRAVMGVRPTASAQEPAPVGTPLRFDDQSEGRIEGYEWDFGDGTVASGPSVSHTYTRPGRFVVRLTVSDGTRTDTATRPVFIAGPAVQPVVADFVFSPERPAAGEAITFTDRSRNGPTSWRWDFGDGTGSTERNPTHTFASPGTYLILLVVNSEAGQRDSKVVRVAVQAGARPAPAAAFSVRPGPAERITGRPITFIDQTDPAGSQLALPRFSIIPGEIPVPPNPGDRSATYTFPTAGEYVVRLLVCWADQPQNCGETSQAIVIAAAEQPPQADFTIGPPSATQDASTNSVYLDTDVLLTATQAPGAQSPVTFRWTIDGEQQNGPTVTLRRTNPVDVAVVLEASNAAGSTSTTKILRFVPRPPTAAFSVSPGTTVQVGDTVRFTSQSTGQITSLSWDFGDGDRGTGATVNHQFTRPGEYTVVLTATGPGGTATERQRVVVEGVPPLPSNAPGAPPAIVELA